MTFFSLFDDVFHRLVRQRLFFQSSPLWWHSYSFVSYTKPFLQMNPPQSRLRLDWYVLTRSGWARLLGHSPRVLRFFSASLVYLCGIVLQAASKRKSVGRPPTIVVYQFVVQDCHLSGHIFPPASNRSILPPVAHMPLSGP